ncbi:MAG: Rieske (2Fe-2S) protein [Armatimonadetes bacterium]|nr:Rieske (2Fe-2S) protein [Armatimonadota bacterium]
MSEEKEQAVDQPAVEAAEPVEPEAGCCCRCGEQSADEPSAPGRRAALAAVVGGVGLVYAAGLAYPVYKYLATAAELSAAEEKQTEISLDGADTMAPGTAMVFKFGGRPTLLIHHPDSTWSAMTAVCTHLGCTVAYQADQNRIHCACHGGVYDPKTGANVSGPPPKPLKTYAVAVAAGKVVVSRA